MIYVASPYSSDLAGSLKLQLEAQRYQAVVGFVLAMTREGYPAFSPIVYYHPFAITGKMPTDAEFWWGVNAAYLRHAAAVFALHLPGWDQSKGMQVELKQAKMLSIPVEHFGPDFKRLQ